VGTNRKIAAQRFGDLTIIGSENYSSPDESTKSLCHATYRCLQHLEAVA
jgi:hypothetical protein